MIRSKIKEERGFIAIVALGMLTIMMVFMISYADTIINAAKRLKMSMDRDIAAVTADSVMEYMLYGKLNRHESGYNFIVPPCVYGDLVEGTQNDGKCDKITEILGEDLDKLNKNVEITMTIKGRSDEDDKFTGNCSGLMPGQGCFVVPLPGTGNAGERCNMYRPGSDKEAQTLIDHKGQVLASGVSGMDGIEQIDYSCNWNKLAFGSNVVDRVAIPFYYDRGDDVVEIFNPYNDSAGVDQAFDFAVRIRPPCLPCSDPDRDCAPGDDETICRDDERYELSEYEDDGRGNDIVVQWQLSGECEGEEYGLMQYVDFDGEEIDEIESSAITEVRINRISVLPHVVLSSAFSEGLDTSTYSETAIKIIDKLEEMEKPIFTLFLNEKLMSDDGKNIPYLEYQILTDQPIGSPKIKVEVMVKVDEYVAEKTIYKTEQVSLIDFAIQN